MNLELQGEYILEEGALEGSYRAVELQFHWGSNDKRGAEHIIDDYVAPMEVYNMVAILFFHFFPVFLKVVKTANLAWPQNFKKLLRAIGDHFNKTLRYNPQCE